MPRGKALIKKNEVTTYEDFTRRSVKGDNLEGHEIWQHANLKSKGLATTRLSTDASKNNPVIALERPVHVNVNRAQSAINASNQTARQNIESNIEALRNSGVPRKVVNKAAKNAVKHAQNLGEM